MRNAVIENGIVTNVILGSLPGADVVPDDGTAQIGGTWDGQSFHAPIPDSAAVRAIQALEIDEAVAAVYGRFTRFAQEYEERESQAKAYKDAGYTGAVPQQVAAFATPAGVLPKDAADTILAQAAQLRGALSQLGVLRMRKYEILRAATDADASAASAQVLAAVQAIDRALT